MSSARSATAVLAAMSLAVAVFPAAILAAETEAVSSGFETPAESARFVPAGGAAADTAAARSGRRALRIPPRASAELKLWDADGAGRATFWIHDDMTLPADTRKHHVGPRWGLKAADGRILAAGCFYAPYLAGERTYAISESPDGKFWFAKVSYLGESQRARGWHKWTFTLDPDRGAVIEFDDRDVNAARKRFDWDSSGFRGFSAVVFLGDEDPGGATFLVDDFSAASLGKMNVAPAPPPVVPGSDPPAEKAVKLRYADPAVHPRLLFGPEDIAAMRRFVASPEGRVHMRRLQDYRAVSRPPRTAAFLQDATDGQRQGLWRLPTVALHHLLTGDSQSLDDAAGFLRFFQTLPHWETGAERDSGMSSANILAGAALAFDWLYNDLDPLFREQFRRTLWQKARAQYHGGHLRKNPGNHYWQGDPQNNHRWHRDAGLTLAALAAARGDEDEQWLLGKIADEIDFVARWLPADGSSHESASYLVFGAAHLTLAMQAADRGFGREHLRAPFFRNVGAFRVHSLLPGMKDGFSYGDGEGLGHYNNFLVKTAAVHRQAALAGAIERMRAVAPSAFDYAWFDIVWTDPALKPAPIEAFPTAGLYPDIGTLFIRDSWRDDAVAAMFRCGPFGGHTLNRFRNENDFCYINVAHDDPDANSFTLFSGPDALAETDRYSQAKKSANHNTVLVNGIGQEAKGRAEGGVWSQPATGKTDMTTMAFLTAWKETPAVTVIEGEAAGAYPALDDRRRGAARPALERFRRTFVWVAGRYVLVLDDLRAPSPVTFDWLMQGPELVAECEKDMRFRLVNGGKSCPFAIAATTPLSFALRQSPADHRGQPLGWRQLVATATVPALRVASVYAPWGGEFTVELREQSADAAAIVVKRDNRVEDTWQWHSAGAATVPGRLRRLPAGGTPAFEIGETDKPPAP